MARKNTASKKKAAGTRRGSRAAGRDATSGRSASIAGRSGSTARAEAKIPHHSIRSARDKLSQIVAEVHDSSSAAVSLGRRESRSAVVLSYERFKPMLSDDYASRLAFVIAENLLGDAPLHIRKPQIEELSRLGKQDLLTLASIEQLPLTTSRRKAIEAQLENKEALDRLTISAQLAQAISAARDKGLYDSAEHLTSQVDLDDEA